MTKRKHKPIIICTRFTNGLYTQQSEFFPVPSPHETYVRNRIPRGAHYEPTDDGPEVDIIRRIHASHTLTDPQSAHSTLMRNYAEKSAEDVFLTLSRIEACREALKG